MKVFFRNLIIILVYLTSVPFWRRLFLAKPLVRVWCLHEVKDHQVNEFKQKIVWLKKKFNIITPEQFKHNNLVKNKINILITFDDGYESWFKNVLPVLEAEKIKAIFFINQDFYSEQQKLLANGHALGGHSATHQRLTKIPPESLAREINQSIKSEFFAYPYGDRHSFNQTVISEVKKAGFKCAFTILPGFNNIKINSYLLHRDSLDANTPNWLFKLWLKGAYDLSSTFKCLAKGCWIY